MKQASADEDEWTEATEADVPRADLVGAAANGVPGFLVMKQDATALLDADYVRDLIAKAEPEAPEPQETVTMTGSPAAMAAMIHGAAVRKAEPAPVDDEIAKAEKTTASINNLPDSEFGYIEPGGKKDESGRTVPRSLRHFPLMDAPHVRDALSRAPQSPFGDKAMPKIRAAAKKFGIDVAKQADETPESSEVAKDMAMDTDETDGMDTTVILAEPDEDMPGSPSEPGSPAWEAIDAATACKWTAILARARAALDLMADREMLEAAGADPADAGNAMDLQDASCAIDYVIATLAPFAVNEQSEADQGAMEMIGKAMGEFNQAPIALLEALAPLAKSGRVLSTQNENAIRTAVASLQKVLASLPPAPDAPDGGQPVAKTANEEPDMPAPTPSEDVTAASGQQPAMGIADAPAKPVAGQAVTEMTKTDAQPVAKAEKTPQVAIYDADGKLVGTVDPAEITMLAPAKAPEAAAKSDDAIPEEPAAPAADAPAAPPTDMTPAPAAAVGTPADAVPADDDTVAKATEDTTEDPQTVLKGSVTELVKAAIAEHSAPQAELIKSLEGRNRALEERNEELTKQAAALNERLTRVENQPAVMAIASNGAIPPAHQMRGQDYGDHVDVTKAEQLRTAFKGSDDARQQKVLAEGLNELAIEKLREIHAAGPR